MRHGFIPAFAGAVSAAALGACGSGEPASGSGAFDRLASRVDAAADDSEASRRGGAVDVDRAFWGRNLTVSFDQYAPDRGPPFPARFEKPGALGIVTPEPASAKQVELLLRELTGLNVVVRTRYRSGEENLDIPINGKIRINHDGTLSELVRSVAAVFDLSWRFDGETIFFDRMDTRSYDVPLPASSGVLSTRLSGVNVAGNSVSTAKNIEFDPWKELTAALESVVAAPGRVTTSPNTGRVTVFAPASEQEEAAKIVKTFDELYSRRIGLEIATFHIDVEKSAELTADIGVSVESGDLTASLGRGLAAALRGGVGVVSGREASASFNLRALSGHRGVADHRMSNTVAQNGVIAPVVLTNSRKYVSGITRGDGEAGPTVTTDNINSGISIYALPRLMRNGRIHLSVWLTQSELNSLTTFDTGTGYVQLPDADQRAVEYTLIMDPGETLVMGGYEQERSSSGRRGGLGGLGALGLRGTRETETKRVRMVLMVRPFIIGS